jgi:type IV pilus assembly protein PilB
MEGSPVNASLHRPALPPASEADALDAVPEHLARRSGVLPLRIEQGVLTVGVDIDRPSMSLEAVRVAAGMAAIVTEVHPGSARRVIGLLARRRIERLSQAITSGSEPDAVSMLAALLDDAVTADASDLHVDAEEGQVRIRLRIDGALHERALLASGLRGPLLARIKVLAGLDAAQQRTPQDGRFTHVIEHERIDVRVATMPTRHGERATLRLLPNDVTVQDLAGLGLSPLVHDALLEAGATGDGLILVCGPTGSGKTTTLHALVRAVAAGPRHVVTLEDPIERVLPGASQTQVDPSAGITFASGLRHLLRQDPDVVLVGEIRDAETALLAVEAAHTGHLVLASLHAVDAPGAVERLVQLGASRSLVVEGLRVVVAQRLLPVPCPDCVEALPALDGEAASRRCAGCDGTGSRGRHAIAELFAPDGPLRDLLRHAPDDPETIRRVAAACLPRLREVGLACVDRGTARRADVLRATPATGDRTAHGGADGTVRPC